MKNKLALASFRLKHFKAVQDSKTIKFTPLTAFIGNNGSGKSSIVEALETLQRILLDDLDTAMETWHGFEYIWNQACKHKLKKNIPKKNLPNELSNPMTFILSGRSRGDRYKAHLEFTANPTLDEVFYRKYETDFSGKKTIFSGHLFATIVNPPLDDMVQGWQFLSLDPSVMAEPVPQKRFYKAIKLQKNGSNIAEYLQTIRDMDVHAFNGIIETLKVVLPYALDLQPNITSELGRKMYLTLSEENILKKLPGWLLSTGTLRILALLSVLRHPEPPSVVFIEEIENGLDPRSVHLIVDEINNFIESGRGQVVLTTHSPYFLDLLKLSQIVVVDRDDSNTPQFFRPASRKNVKEWAEKFSPGKLYTMGTLARGE